MSRAGVKSKGPLIASELSIHAAHHHHHSMRARHRDHPERLAETTALGELGVWIPSTSPTSSRDIRGGLTALQWPENRGALA